MGVLLTILEGWISLSICEGKGIMLGRREYSATSTVLRAQYDTQLANLAYRKVFFEGSLRL